MMTKLEFINNVSELCCLKRMKYNMKNLCNHGCIIQEYL